MNLHKKISFTITLLTIAAFTAAQNTRPLLLAPGTPEKILPVEGKFFLPAFNLEMLKQWPEDLHAYRYITSGKTTTYIQFKDKHQLLRMPLAQALQKNKVALFTITATASGRPPGVIIEPLADLRFIALTTRGMILSDDSTVLENPTDTALFSITQGGYALNTLYDLMYRRNQQFLWEYIYNKTPANGTQQQALTNLFVQNILRGSGRLPPYYDLKKEQSNIFIHAGKINYDSTRPSAVYYNDDGAHYMMLREIMQELKQAIEAEKKDSIALTMYFSKERQALDSVIITGKYKGLLPLHIQFTSEQPVMMIARYAEGQAILNTTAAYKVSALLSYDFGDAPEICRIPFPSQITYPFTGPPINLNVCGITISQDFGELLIGL